MKEHEVKRAINSYFEDRDYFVPSTEFNVGVKPDVTAFKWAGNDYEIKTVAVECKANKTLRKLMEVASTQTRALQVYFPHVYLAHPALRQNDLAALRSILKPLHIGFLSVDPRNGEVSENFPTNVSATLKYDDFLFQVRQRAAAVLAYIDVFGRSQDLNTPVRFPSLVACFVKEQANFLLRNDFPDENYHLGICVEQKRYAKKALSNVKPTSFHKLLTDLNGNYSLDLEYVAAYRPREVYWPLLREKVNELSLVDVRLLLNICRQKDWRIRLMVHKIVWQKDEVLNRHKHQRRIQTAKSELEPLRQLLRNQL